MKLNRWLMAAALAAGLCLSVNQGLAQPNNQGNPGGRPGRGNFDPAQMRERMMQGIKEGLEITDDAEWNALQPMVTKVMELQRQVAGDRMRGFFGRRGGGDNGGDQTQRRVSMFGGQAMPEAEALQRAIDGKASNSDLKTAVAKYNEARKAKQVELEKAQADLRKALSVRQEAILTSRGLL